jgi:hypothetical protein
LFITAAVVTVIAVVLSLLLPDHVLSSGPVQAAPKPADDLDEELRAELEAEAAAARAEAGAAL